LREISPTIYFNVPKGYEELVAALRQDAGLRERFFSKLRLTFYSGASLPRHIADQLNELAEQTIGKRILMVTGFGSTETAPAAIVNTHRNARLGNVGVPLPGVAIKLVPLGGKLEARIKAPSVMPGYWRDPEMTANAFDAEGFYRFGDAFRFADPCEPAEGLIFDGRVSEDFKLATGTWVSVGPLRARLIAALAPLAKDAVIAGHDRDEVTALVFPDLDACRRLVGIGVSDAKAAELIADGRLRAAVRARLADLAATSTGSSTRIARVILLDELPSIDAGEITDKGSINQRVVLTRRATLLEDLYADTPTSRVLSAGLDHV
jgi:feruloyl-CoA synthase